MNFAEKFQENIEWSLADFSIFEIYDKAVANFGDGSTFVEIGCFKGGSVIYLASRIQMAVKKIQVYAVDIWENMIAPNTEGSIFYDFWHHVMVWYCHQVIKPIQFDSARAANLFDDKSIEFVFIDGDHSYEGIKRDVEAWLPKIRPGGWIAGHDYNQLVEKYINDKFEDYEIEVFTEGCRSFLVRL